MIPCGSQFSNVFVHQSSLYIDLIIRVKDSVRDAGKLFTDNFIPTGDSIVEAPHIIGLVQSGVLSIELLAVHVRNSKDSTWLIQLEECLDVQLFLINEISRKLQKNEPDALFANVFTEVIKLLGSLFLCCANLCAAVGLAVLPKLSALVQSILENITANTEALLCMSRESGTAVRSEQSGKRKKLKQSLKELSNPVLANRSRILLLRSAVSAIAVLASSLPKIMHPFVEDCIITSLSIFRVQLEGSATSSDYTIKEGGLSLSDDIYRGLVIMISNIPPRLCVPKLIKTSQTLNEMTKGSSRDKKYELLLIFIRFVELLSDYWEIMDRSSVAANLSHLGPLLLDVMGLRFNSSIQSDMSRSLDDKVANACVQLCLKLTEAELRAFLVHAIEWVNSTDNEDENQDDINSDNWLKYARMVCFFHCVSALIDRFKGVFAESMGCIWDFTCECLANNVRILTSGALSIERSRDSEVHGGSSKKRKGVDTTGSNSALCTIHELVLLSSDILTSICRCCRYDRGGFMNEVKCIAVL